METPEPCIVEDVHISNVSIPRGGPIYVPDMVSSLTRVSDFESAVFNELKDLREEICSGSIDTSDEDISVDELKIITEEELIEKAFELAFKDDHVNENSSQVPEEHSNACLENSGRGKDSAPSNDLSNGSSLRMGDSGQLGKNTSKKRKRKGQSNQKNDNLEESYIANVDPVPSNNLSNGSSLRTGNGEQLDKNTSKKWKRMWQRNRKNGNLEESYIAKVKELARIKQKQEEDKASAKLKSINWRNNCSEKTERITTLKSTSSKTKVTSSNAEEHVPVIYPEIVLCVEVYHNRGKRAKNQEFMVLGQQPLSELRDKINCLTDEIMKKAGQHDPSGYFLIEDVFCNDLREPSAIDYSRPILDWLRDSKKDALEKWESIFSGELQQKHKAILGRQNEPKLPKFKTVKMHQTRFCDLRFRLGAGYLYCHQGDCKHMIVIRDMRLIHPEDVQNRAAYPVVSYEMALRFRKCDVCNIYRAEKVTVDDKWAQENPCYFCGLCYYMLHYIQEFAPPTS